MRVLPLLVLCLVFWSASASLSSAQDRLPEGTVRIVLTDGTALVGVIQSESEDMVSLLTTSGLDIQIPRAQIRSVTSVAGRQFSQVDPNRSRLLFSPTAHALEKGHGYVADYELFFPFVAYGASNNLILAGGISIFPGSPVQILYLAPKLTVYSSERAAFAVGTMFNIPIGSAVEDDISGFGMVYGVGTFGSDVGSVSVGSALGYADGDFAKNPAIMLGGQRQVSNSISLISENYLILGIENAIVFSGGIRFFGERLSTDIAFVTFPDLLSEGSFPFIPWLGFAYNW